MILELDMPNLFSSLPEQLPEELEETILETENLRLVKIVSTGQATPAGEWYDQPTNEWVILLTGRAGLLFEGRSEVVIMEPGDYINIPAHQRHRLEWTAPRQATVWLALHY
ncbi:MAG: cupin domain-containing protein [Desulfobacca sp.]|nr:cupin domain-containing protein [Desulfobacca sp.]